MIFKRNTFTIILLGLALVLSVTGLSRRWNAERAHRQIGFIVETSDVRSLARQSGLTPGELLGSLKKNGTIGVAVNELSGLDLAEGQAGYLYGPLASFPEAQRLLPTTEKDQALIILGKGQSWAAEARDYLGAKYPGLRVAEKAGKTFLLLPRSVSELEKAGVAPDFAGLDLARSERIPVIFRPAPCPGTGADRVIASLESLLKTRPEIHGILPQGLIIMGAPEVGRVGEWIRTRGLFLAQAEFNRQLGAEKLNRGAYPALIPIHSVTTDEVIAKRMTREALVERMVRAAVERSVPLLLLRSYEIDTGGRTESLVEDMGKIKADLESRGFGIGWTTALEDWKRPFAGALAFGIVCSLFFTRVFLRFRGNLTREIGPMEGAFVVLLGLGLSILMLRVSIVARLAGAAGSALIATEATLWTLGQYRKPVRGLLGGLALTVTGGLALAAFFSTPQTMLRLEPFSGVKATLLLPPLLVFAHDMKRKIYPESVRELILKPMIWIEFLLVSLILVAAAILALRSDNTAFVGGWERNLRDLLERILVARPRTKELFIGYPALILWFAMARNNWARHAWVLPRAAAAIGFASAVNSFCHFHTRLPFILFRVFNGWWSGILVGVAVILCVRFAILPLARRWRFALWR